MDRLLRATDCEIGRGEMVFAMDRASLARVGMAVAQLVVALDRVDLASVAQNR